MLIKPKKIEPFLPEALRPLTLIRLLKESVLHASPSRVAFAEYTVNDTARLVALKAYLTFVPTTTPPHRGTLWRLKYEASKLDYEEKVYKFIKENKLAEESVNFIDYIDSIAIDQEDLHKLLRNPEDVLWRNFLQPLLFTGDDYTRIENSLITGVNIVITSTFSTINILEKEIREPETSICWQPIDFPDSDAQNEYECEWLKNITFQIIYAFAELAKKGIQHNDGHIGNILISKFPDVPLKVKYGETYAIPAHYGRILLFDWDLAYVNGQPNPYLTDKENMCEPYGVCNSMNACFDIYLTLTSLCYNLSKEKTSIHLRYPEFVKFIKTYLPSPTKLEESNIFLKEVTHLCFADPADEDLKCSPFVPKADVCFTPEQMLAAPYFNDYKIQNKTKPVAVGYFQNLVDQALIAYGLK